MQQELVKAHAEIFTKIQAKERFERGQGLLPCSCTGYTAEQLQPKLEAALEAEPYEEATRLRDVIRQLRQAGIESL